jgi:hypothetical protein
MTRKYKIVTKAEFDAVHKLHNLGLGIKEICQVTDRTWVVVDRILHIDSYEKYPKRGRRMKKVVEQVKEVEDAQPGVPVMTDKEIVNAPARVFTYIANSL